MKVKVLNILVLMFIAVFALSAANASATPTMSSMAGTYSSEASGYNIVLYENGSASFSGHSGTWNIKNATTFEGIYTIVSQHTDYFTITNNGFTAVSTGNLYVKIASASSTPTPTASASPTTSPTVNPSVPEFSSVALILIAAGAVAVTLCTIELAAKNRHVKKP